MLERNQADEDHIFQVLNKSILKNSELTKKTISATRNEAIKRMAHSKDVDGINDTLLIN
jgi:hypothetical protein